VGSSYCWCTCTILVPVGLASIGSAPRDECPWQRYKGSKSRPPRTNEAPINIRLAANVLHIMSHPAATTDKDIIAPPEHLEHTAGDYDTGLIGASRWGALRRFWWPSLLCVMACLGVMNDGYQNQMPGMQLHSDIYCMGLTPT
jgi:hypothetical protein